LGKLIGIFSTEISSRIQGSLYTELHKEAKNNGYNLVFFSANRSRKNAYDTENSALVLYKMAENMDFAAFIIYVQSIRSQEFINYIIDLGKRRDIPVFLYDCDAFGYTKDNGVITINLDYKQGFAECVKHLLEFHNCKNIYMLAGLKDNKFSDDRIDAYKTEMLAHGLQVSNDKIMYGDFWEKPAREALNKMMDSDLPKPDAICCANDYMAIVAAEVVQARGYKVPEDIRITGFDGIEDGKYNFPVISTCEPNLEIVPKLIFDAIENGTRIEDFLVPLTFYPKESCGCEYSNNANDREEMAQLMINNRLNANQHAMLSNMQIHLMDSCNPDEITNYMQSMIDVFKGYKHLYCFRNDFEYLDDFSTDFDMMRVQLNIDMLSEEKCEVFPAKDIIPDFDNIITNAGSDDFFVFNILQSLDKKYGYTLIKADFYSTNLIKIFEQFNESFTNMVEIVLRNRRLELTTQKLSEMYEHMSELYIRDMMTGLYNRTGYYNELDSYIAKDDVKDKFIHIIAIDMDGMKTINDNYGHQEGDLAICSVAKAINSCIAYPCIRARFGGDEFMVALFSDFEEKPSSELVSDRLNHYLKTLPALEGKPYTVGVSVGSAACTVADFIENDIHKLEKQADANMYLDKKRRKDLA